MIWNLYSLFFRRETSKFSTLKITYAQIQMIQTRQQLNRKFWNSVWLIFKYMLISKDTLFDNPTLIIFSYVIINSTLSNFSFLFLFLIIKKRNCRKFWNVQILICTFVVMTYANYIKIELTVFHQIDFEITKKVVWQYKYLSIDLTIKVKADPLRFIIYYSYNPQASYLNIILNFNSSV